MDENSITLRLHCKDAPRLWFASFCSSLDERLQNIKRRKDVRLRDVQCEEFFYSGVFGRDTPRIRYTAAEAPARLGSVLAGRTARSGGLVERLI